MQTTQKLLIAVQLFSLLKSSCLRSLHSKLQINSLNLLDSLNSRLYIVYAKKLRKTVNCISIISVLKSFKLSSLHCKLQSIV